MYNAQQRRAMMNPNGGGVGACGGGPYGAGGGAGQMFRGFAPGVARPAAAPVAPAYASGMSRILQIPRTDIGSAAVRQLILANWSNIPVLQAVWFLIKNTRECDAPLPNDSLPFVPDTLQIPSGSAGAVGQYGEPMWAANPRTVFWSGVAMEIANRLLALGSTYPFGMPIKVPSDVVGAP